MHQEEQQLDGIMHQEDQEHDGEIVRLHSPDNGRSCTQHACCGHHVVRTQQYRPVQEGTDWSWFIKFLEILSLILGSRP
jgi:hypothetical protein